MIHYKIVLDFIDSLGDFIDFPKKAADLANASCVQAAVTAAGTATTDLHILEGSMPKAGILRATWNEKTEHWWVLGWVGCFGSDVVFLFGEFLNKRHFFSKLQAWMIPSSFPVFLPSFLGPGWIVEVDLG